MTLEMLKREVIKRSFRIKRMRKERIIAGCIAKMNHGRWSIKMNCGYKSEEELERYYVEPLKSALKKLGKLAHKTGDKNNYLGNCAEQRACNEVLRKDRHHPVAVDQVAYTPAYRVRTSQVRDYCFNCVSALGIKN